MPYTTADFPLTTDQPQIEVTLPVGQHVFELVVEDTLGQQSEPARITITVIREHPEVHSITPTRGLQDQKVQAVISGKHLGEVTAVLFRSDSGITAEIENTSETSVELSLTIASDAKHGAYPFRLRTPREEIASGDVKFQVIAKPVIFTIEPPQAEQGQTLTAIISGEYLGKVTAVLFPPFSGVTAKIENTTETSLEVHLTIAPDGKPGTYPFQLQMPEGDIESGGVVFEVTGKPLITAVQPNQAEQGQTLTAVISGLYLDETTAVLFPNYSGIKAKLLQTSEKSVTVDLMIPSDATPGTYQFHLQTPGGKRPSEEVRFKVTAKPQQPVITAIEPNRYKQGIGVEVVISGEHLGETTAVLFPDDSGIKAELVKTSETSLVVNLTIPVDAKPGKYPFQLQMPGEDIGSGDVTFEVTAVQTRPEIATIVPNSALRGTTETDVHITGHYLRGYEHVIFLLCEGRDCRKDETLLTKNVSWERDPRSRQEFLKLDVVISRAAILGPRAFVLTTADGTSRLQSPPEITFTVEHPREPKPPVIPIEPKPEPPRRPIMPRSDSSEGPDLEDVKGIAAARRERLEGVGITSVDALAKMEPEQLAEILETSRAQATSIVEEARRLLQS